MLDTSLRVMQLGPTLYQGGVAVAIQQLSLALSQLGHQVMLVGNGGEGIDGLKEQGITYQEVNWSQKPFTLLQTVRQIRQAIKTFQPDIVHVHGRGAALACTLAGRKPDWFTLHNSHLTHQVGILDKGWIRKYFSPLGHRIFVLDQGAIPYVAEQLNFDPHHIAVISNGVDCERFRPPTDAERSHARSKFGIDERDVMAVFVGRFHEQKQPEAVIELAAAVRDAGFTNVRFALIGAGELETALREQIRDRHLESTCQIHAWMDPLSAYWSADLLLMPSRYEGFGLVAAEALACGCPVLRTRTGGYDRMIQEGKTGFGSDTSPEAFVQRGMEVLRHPEALAAMRSPARAWVEKHLSLRQQAEQTITAYFHYRAERSPVDRGLNRLSPDSTN